MQKKVFVISLLLLTITINTSFAFLIRNFGGIVGPIFPICANGILFYLQPPTKAPQMAGIYFFPFGGLLYKWYQLPRPGLKILGKAFPKGCCLICTPGGCSCFIPDFTVMFMGTSLF